MKHLTKFLILALIAFSTLHVYAQQTTGEITGTVTDASGAVVPGATVTATEAATQQIRSTTSNDAGNYVLPYMPPGNYTLKASKAGFKMETGENLLITVGEEMRMDFKMQIGEVTEQVEVSTAAPLLSTESVAVQTDIGSQQIVALPLNGRDYLQLVALTANVVNEPPSNTNGAGGLQGGVRSNESISVAGQRLEFNHYTLDGVENTDPNFNSYIIHPSVDALQEFTVLTGVYSAEFGRGAGQINATTLPGGNSYHGVAYDFIRNDYVDAKNWEQVGNKDNFHRSDYGFVLDGPLSVPHLYNAKNKLFFASSFESLTDNDIQQQTGSVPTAAMLQGNLSLFGIAPVYDPLTINPAAKTGTQISYNGQLNVIPPSRISPQALALYAYMLPPNQFGGANEEVQYANDLKTQEPQTTQSTQFNQRIDFTQNPRSSWFARFSWENDRFSPSTLVPRVSVDQALTTVRQTVIGNTFIINQHMVNDARFAWDQFNNSDAGYYYNSGTNVEGGLGITGLTATGPQDDGVPAMSISGISGGGDVVPYVTHDDLFQGIDSVSIVMGNHSIKVGGMIERDRYNQFGNQKAAGEFDFNGTATQLPGPAGTKTGFALGDFLFGTPYTAYRVTALAQVELRRTIYSGFLQDDWKVRRNLTLNLGVRYDNQRPWYDKHDNLINVQTSSLGVYTPPTPWYIEPQSVLLPDAGATTPIITRPGSPGCNFYASPVNFQLSEISPMASDPGTQPIQCGDQFMGRSTVNPNDLDFGPRVGLDWAIGTKWSVRTGYGLYYTNDIGNPMFDMGRNLGGKDGVILSVGGGTTSGLINPALPNPANTLSSPWAAELVSAGCKANAYNGGADYSGPCFSQPQIQATNQNNRQAYVEQYMLNLERQLSKNTSIEVAYLGNESHHLLRDFIFNQSVPKTSASDTSSTTQRRPWPAMGPIQQMRDFDRGVYSAGSIKLTQRVSHGLLYVVGFTWSRSLDFGSAVRPDAGDTLWPTNSYNLRAERGPSQFNQPRRLTTSFVYDLPFGTGRDFVPSNLIVNHVVSGWSFGGILTVGDGTNINAGGLSDTAGLDVQNNQPFYTGVPYVPAQRGASNYWNPLSINDTDSRLSWMTGNMSRNTLYTPGYQDVDASLARTFHVWESHTVQFRFEAFNAINHVNWQVPPSSTTTSGIATFGIVTKAQPMRQLQAAIKYAF